MAVGFLGGRFVFSKERFPAVLRDTFLTGWEFILLGLAIGPLGLNIIGEERIEQLDPFIALGLGWAGLIFGTQLRWADILKVDRSILKLTLFQFLLVWLGLFSFFLFLSFFLFNLPLAESIASACIVAAAGAISSPTALSLIAPALPRSRAGAARSLRIVATLDVAPALVTIGLVFCFFPAESGGMYMPKQGAWLLLYSILMAIALSILFLNFGRDRLSNEEDLSVFIGFIVFMAGIAFYLNLSPLFLSLLTGIILANILKTDDRIFKMMYATEKPFYVIMLIVTGLWWSSFNLKIWFAAGAIVMLRLLIKMAAVGIVSRRLSKENALPEKAGLALCAQGVLALAIGLNFLLVYPGDGPKLVFGVIVIMMIVNEIAAPFLIRRVMSEDDS